VVQLTKRFKTPTCLQVLATIHWMAVQERARSVDEAIRLVNALNARKKQVIDPSHLRIAWDRLSSEGWI